MVLVPGEGGSFKPRQQSKSFARHFGAGGVPILPEAETASPAPRMNLLEPSFQSAHTPRRVAATPEVLSAIEQTALRYAGHSGLRRAGLSVSEWTAFFRANIEIESGYRQSAVSRTGAIGLGQLMPGTAAVLGVNPHDMHQNLDGSARYLLYLLNRFGTKELALAGYNAGPEAVSRHGGIPPYRETIGHVRKVMAVFNRLSGDLL